MERAKAEESIYPFAFYFASSGQSMQYSSRYHTKNCHLDPASITCYIFVVQSISFLAFLIFSSAEAKRTSYSGVFSLGNK